MTKPKKYYLITEDCGYVEDVYSFNTEAEADAFAHGYSQAIDQRGGDGSVYRPEDLDYDEEWEPFDKENPSYCDKKRMELREACRKALAEKIEKDRLELEGSE